VHAALKRELLKRTLSDLDDARDWLVALGRKSAVEKVASFFLRVSRPGELSHSNFVGSSSHRSILNLPLTRSEIADYLGLTVETVSRQIGNLKSQGFIRLIDSRTIELCDRVKLMDVAGSTDQF
jgi:CRP/FNR family transcriptional regulator